MSVTKPQTHRYGHKATTRVGFYGCMVVDGVVRVGLRGDRPLRPMQFPRSATVRCPCGADHKVDLTWRNLGDGEDVRAEVLVDGPEPTKGAG